MDRTFIAIFNKHIDQQDESNKEAVLKRLDNSNKQMNLGGVTRVFENAPSSDSITKSEKFCLAARQYQQIAGKFAKLIIDPKQPDFEKLNDPSLMSQVKQNVFIPLAEIACDVLLNDNKLCDQLFSGKAKEKFDRFLTDYKNKTEENMKENKEEDKTMEFVTTMLLSGFCKMYLVDLVADAAGSNNKVVNAVISQSADNFFSADYFRNMIEKDMINLSSEFNRYCKDLEVRISQLDDKDINMQKKDLLAQAVNIIYKNKDNLLELHGKLNDLLNDKRLDIKDGFSLHEHTKSYDTLNKICKSLEENHPELNQAKETQKTTSSSASFGPKK